MAPCTPARATSGLRVIVGKHRDIPYRGGRTGDWVKLKCIQSEAFMIVGYEPSSGGSFGSLLLAAHRDCRLAYVGSVGTGFKTVEAGRLKATMDNLAWKAKQPPGPYGGKRAAKWVQPTLIAEIEFRAWTDDGKLRHVAYKGLREVQDNADVYKLD